MSFHHQYSKKNCVEIDISLSCQADVDAMVANELRPGAPLHELETHETAQSQPTSQVLISTLCTLFLAFLI
jgi:hypothetical protein